MATYASVAEADAYLTHSSTWSAASTTQKERALALATLYLDGNYSWPGVLADTSQELEWPRSDAYDSEGRTLTGIPDAVKNACIELADIEVSGTPILPVQETSVSEEESRVGPIVERTVYRHRVPRFPVVEALLSGIGRRRSANLSMVRA